jgi:hypothetical protein
MIVKFALICATPFVLLGTVLGITGVALVDVKDSGPDGHHLTIPVPLLVAQAALTFAPDEAKYVECGQFARYQKVATTILDELEHAPDGVLVEVHDNGDSVLIRKEGSLLRINVDEAAGETVECNLPIRSAIKAVEAYDGHGFPTKAAFWALRRAPHGTLVHVKDGEDEVTVRLL